MKNNSSLIAGAAAVKITPKDSQFLFGYPLVERMSEGIHDDLFSTALFLSDGETQLMIIANDVIFVSKESTDRVRKKIGKKTGIPEAHIMISATHTHSGPPTVNFVATAKDPAIPAVDLDYLSFFEDSMVSAAHQAFKNPISAEIGLIIADAAGIGTNRHDPAGPSDLNVPVLLVRAKADQTYIACMLICCMHPTVLHEDSKLYSGDFPGLTREILQKEYLKTNCPVIYHTGPSGNQSPRHVTKENTFQEAERLANILAVAVGKVIDKTDYFSAVALSCLTHNIELPRKTFPKTSQAESDLENSIKRLATLKDARVSPQELRSAEVDWFGAVEALHLSQLFESNQLEETYQSCSPAEIQIFKIGKWHFVAWPGEIFIEYALQLKEQCNEVFLITLANGELQGYVVTEQAVVQKNYEASNAIFDYQSGEVLVSTTLSLLKEI